MCRPIADLRNGITFMFRRFPVVLVCRSRIFSTLTRYKRNVSLWSVPITWRIRHSAMGVLYSLISLDRFTLGIVAVIGLLHFTLRIANKKLRQLPLPPGPKPWPIVGNISDFPTTHEGRFWARHKQLYGNQHLLRLFQYPTYIFSLGPISSVTAIGTTFIILNDIGAAFELLEKRSATYSNRYETTFGAKMYVTTSISYNNFLFSQVLQGTDRAFFCTLAVWSWIKTAP